MKKLLLATVFALAVSPALADTFFATSASVIDAQAVIITDTNRTPFNGGNVLAGQVDLHSNATNTDVLVWCLDIFDGVNLPYLYQVNTYTAGDVRPGMAVLDAAQVRQIAGLMLLGNTEVSDAAVQLAIWRVEYGAAFGDSLTNAGLRAQADQAVFDSRPGGSLDCSHCVLTVFTDAIDNPSQAFGVATLAAVPGPIVGAGLPGVLAMFGVGGWAWRRRKLAA